MSRRRVDWFVVYCVVAGIGMTVFCGLVIWAHTLFSDECDERGGVVIETECVQEDALVDMEGWAG